MPARVLTGKTIRELLTGSEYSIDYYQREYKWQRKSRSPNPAMPMTFHTALSTSARYQ
jgi:hypothetical protein